MGNVQLDRDNDKIRDNVKILHEDELKIKVHLEQFEKETKNNLIAIKQHIDNFKLDSEKEQLLMLKDREAIMHVTTICQGLLQARRGTLAAAIVSREDAKAAVEAASRALSTTSQIAMFSSINTFYDQKTALYSNRTHFHITVGLPVSDKFSWTAYKLASPLMMVHDKLAQLNVPPVVLLNVPLHCDLSTFDWLQCIAQKEGNLCPFPLVSTTTEGCVPALLAGNHTQVEEECAIEFLTQRTTAKATPNWVHIFHLKKETTIINCRDKKSEIIAFQGLKHLPRPGCSMRGKKYFVGFPKEASTSVMLDLYFRNITGGTRQEMLDWTQANKLVLKVGELQHLRLHNFSAAAFEKTHAGKTMQSLAGGFQAAGDALSNTFHFAMNCMYMVLALVVLGLCVAACCMWANRPKPESTVRAMWSALGEKPSAQEKGGP